MRLLFDNNLAPRLARSIDILFLDHEIVALRDKFAANTSDIEWKDRWIAKEVKRC